MICNMMNHMLRHDSLLKMIIESDVDHKTGKGRPRMEYIPQIMKDIGINNHRELRSWSYDRKIRRAQSINQKIESYKREKLFLRKKYSTF